LIKKCYLYYNKYNINFKFYIAWKKYHVMVTKGNIVFYLIWKPQANTLISHKDKLVSNKRHHANPTMATMFMDPKMMFILK
jgi:hypothetical protein